MKKTLKGFITGFVTASLIVAPILSYAEGGQNIEAFFNRIKLVINNTPSTAETLLYNGTTYVPIRAVSEGLGVAVNYDNNTKTAYIDMANKGAELLPAEQPTEGSIWISGRFSLQSADSKDPKTLVITNASDKSFDFQLLDASGTAKLSGKVNTNGAEATYAASDLDILKFTASGNTIIIDEAKRLQIPSGKATYIKEATDVKTSIIVNSWYDGNFILQPSSTSDPTDPITLNISNSTDISFDFKLSDAEGNVKAEGHASVSDNDATYNAAEPNVVKFHIDGDEITITEAKGLQIPSGKAVYKQEDNNSPVSSAAFKEGTYSSGSSASAKTLVISKLTATSFDYKIIESNGKDIITKGTAKITSEGVAECVFDDEYKITFTDAKNNVITAKESVQRLIDKGEVKFYTV